MNTKITKKSPIPSIYFNVSRVGEMTNKFHTKIMKDNLYNRAYDSIYEAFEEKEDVALITEVNYSCEIVAIERCNWPRVINTAIEYKTEHENYEECAKFQKLLNRIELV